MIEGKLRGALAFCSTGRAPARCPHSWRFLVMRRTPASKAVQVLPQTHVPQHKQSANGPGAFSLKASESNCGNPEALAAFHLGRSNNNERAEHRVSRRPEFERRYGML